MENNIDKFKDLNVQLCAPGTDFGEFFRDFDSTGDQMPCNFYNYVMTVK